MNLKEYMETYKIGICALAKRCGVSHPTMINALKGYEMKLSIALKIERGTGGEVMCRDMRPTAKRVKATTAGLPSEVQQLSDGSDDKTYDTSNEHLPRC